MRMRAFLFLACLLLAPVAPAVADSAGSDGIAVEQAWARPTLGRAPNSAAFFRIRNDGPGDDRLVAARSPVAARAEIHAHEMDDGVMRMRPVAGGVEIASGSTVEFAPGGLHVMLMGLTQRLEAGSDVPLTLVFRDAGEITLRAAVSMAGPGHDEDGGAMEHGSEGHDDVRHGDSDS